MFECFIPTVAKLGRCMMSAYRFGFEDSESEAQVTFILCNPLTNSVCSCCDTLAKGSALASGDPAPHPGGLLQGPHLPAQPPTSDHSS